MYLTLENPRSIALDLNAANLVHTHTHDSMLSSYFYIIRKLRWKHSEVWGSSFKSIFNGIWFSSHQSKCITMFYKMYYFVCIINERVLLDDGGCLRFQSVRELACVRTYVHTRRCSVNCVSKKRRKKAPICQVMFTA